MLSALQLQETNLISQNNEMKNYHDELLNPTCISFYLYNFKQLLLLHAFQFLHIDLAVDL